VAVPAGHSGVTFANTLQESSALNYFMYEYLYNGAGVAVGDLNNDGLQDLYFCGNMVEDRLYLNKGGLQFEDVTAKAGFGAHTGWHTGVTMADVNNDGWLDIHVCRAGWAPDPAERTNLMYMNNGDMTFTERAAELGIADTTRTTQAVFFDHDRDGDLDLYTLNCPIQERTPLSSKQVEELVRQRKGTTGRLFRNDGARFTDITFEAGLYHMGYGLGVAVSDFDGDGWTDIYVANDYMEPDRMFLSDGKGHYTDVVKQRTRHISNYAMGCDAADVNNDGATDLLVLDMVSEDHVRSKKNMGAMSTEKFWSTVAAGMHYQFMFNTLQLNNGNGTFSDIAQLAGISKTDWSWAPLFADLDNDGWKDLLVTNGYKRDTRDNDYYVEARKLKETGKPVKYDELLKLIPTNKVRNYLFRNNGDLTFQDRSVEWGITEAINSNGAAYADLDNDGDLDLVINNMEEKASILENTAANTNHNHHLRVKLEGAGTALAMNAHVKLTAAGASQFQEAMPTRGYESCVENILHFGLGSATVVDELQVTWPDGLVSTLRDVKADQVVEVPRSSAVAAPPAPPVAAPFFAEQAQRLGIDFQHQENAYNDFAQEVLLPHKQSENGPLLAVGDADGDGREDLFVGGARGQSGELFLQRADGTFTRAASQPWSMHKGSEDMGSLFFDADGDGDKDLYVVSGSNETDLFFDQYFNRLYLNDGHATFHYDAGAVPPLATSAMRVAAADIDGDRDLDLFVGGRITPGQYPKAPRSYLLLNDGNGRFSDATEQLAPELLSPGLVTDAEFLDYDNDRDPDLVVVGEWMPIGIFENTNGRFTNTSAKSGLTNTEGWWWSLTSGDVDGDGDPDLVCGNLGWNNKFHCSPEHPFHVYWADFDDNGHSDIVLAKESAGIGLVPVRGRECSSQQCAMIKDKFPTYDAFARASVERIYSPEKIAQALHLEAKHMRSCVLINEGKGRFALRDLPNAAQTAPIMGSALFDADGDGHMDLVVAGNLWGAEVETERYDAGTGLLLLGDGKGGFAPQTIARSGIFAWGNVKDLALVRRATDGAPLIVVANNNERLQVFAPGGGGSLLAER